MFEACGLKPSEALRRGAKLTKPIKGVMLRIWEDRDEVEGTEVGDVSCCALGAILVGAVGLDKAKAIVLDHNDGGYTAVTQLFPVLGTADFQLPGEDKYTFLRTQILARNDRWFLAPIYGTVPDRRLQIANELEALGL